jgi:hypothetical protein
MKSHNTIKFCFSSAFIILFIAALAGQKNIDQVLRKYKNDEGVMNMNFTGEVKKYLQSANVKLESEIDNIDVLIFEKNKNISSKDEKQIIEVLIRDGYDLMVDVRNKGEKVKLHVLESGNYLSKVFAHIESDDSNIYFIITGKIKPDELSKLNLNFDGSEALKMTGKK